VLLLMMWSRLPINAVSFLCAKLMGLPVAIVLYGYSSKQTFYYFRNAGYRTRWIALATFLPDILVYSFIVFLSTIMANA
jgi:hypothetical protein